MIVPFTDRVKKRTTRGSSTLATSAEKDVCTPAKG